MMHYLPRSITLTLRFSGSNQRAVFFTNTSIPSATL
jgi:hypothetical protein